MNLLADDFDVQKALRRDLMPGDIVRFGERPAAFSTDEAWFMSLMRREGRCASLGWVRTMNPMREETMELRTVDSTYGQGVAHIQCWGRRFFVPIDMLELA